MSYQYDLYLETHKENVKRGYDWICEHLPDLLNEDFSCSWQIEYNHDASKSQMDEYEAYDAYFYGGNRSYAVVQEFRRAWLLHIHRNPHHWQHWVLINDDPNEGEIILEMPYDYILEMVCDWWSFSWSTDNLYGIFSWYEEHKDYMKLGEKTRKTVEDILEKIKSKLDEAEDEVLGDSELQHHGVKGMKWGVKNGPPYPIDKSGKHDKIVKEAIESGEVSKKINREKQMRHTKSNHAPGRSYLDGDLEYAQELVDRYSGQGTPLVDGKGRWLRKEKVEASEIIGTHVDENKNETKTNKGMIVYSKTGTHIYPRKEKS